MSSFRVATILAVGALALSACGGGGDDEAAAPAGAAETPAAQTVADPETAIQNYFTAMRDGKARDVCALEAEAFQQAKYGSAGQACLQDAANNQPQTVWADPVKIVSQETLEDSATAVLQPNAGSSAEATIELTLVDGDWLVASLM